MKTKIAKVISIITVVPFSALSLLTTVFLFKDTVFVGNSHWYGISILCLTVIPLSAYILKNFIPFYKNQGRRGERRLAFIMGIIGQVSGMITAFIFNAPKGVKIIFFAYFLSGLVLSSTNAIIKFKASGHACGVSGPLALLFYFFSYRIWPAVLILPLVFWARLQLKRHTIRELFSGTFIGVIYTLIVIAVSTGSI